MSACVAASCFMRTSRDSSSESTVCGAVVARGRHQLHRAQAQHELLDMIRTTHLGSVRKGKLCTASDCAVEVQLHKSTQS